MSEHFPAGKSRLFTKLEKQTAPSVIVVRGLGRETGTTSIAANLALLLAMGGRETLALDLCLWNCRLTTSLGISPSADLQELANEFLETGDLTPGLLRTHIQQCRPLLGLLPTMEDWLQSYALREVDGWNFVCKLLTQARESQICQWIVVDLGSHDLRRLSELGHRLEDYMFAPTCAVHLAILNSATWIINVFGSKNSLELWTQAEPSQPLPTDLYVANWCDPPNLFNLPNIDHSILKQTVFIPTVGSLIPDSEHTEFFVERCTAPSASLSKSQKHALDGFKKLVAKVIKL
jgi:cellulose biosynthesis protein BcsQ